MPETKKPLKKPRWRKRLLWLSLVLGSLCIALNGPVARWALSRTIDSLLSKQGLTGLCEISGSLNRGFQLRNAHYSGPLGIQKITLQSAEIRYNNILAISKLQLESISLTGASVVIDTAKFPEKTDSEPRSLEQNRALLARLHTLLRAPKIQLSKLDLHLHSAGIPRHSIQLASFQHSANSALFELRDLQYQRQENWQLPSQDIQLLWNAHSLTVSEIYLTPDLAVSNTTLDWKNSPSATAELLLHGAKLHASLKDSATLQLAEGTLPLDQLSTYLPRLHSLDLAGNITQLDATLDNWLQPIPAWKIKASANAKDLQTTHATWGDAQLQLTQENTHFQLGLNLSERKNSLQLQGHWTQPKHKNWWQHIDLQSNCSLHDLKPILASLPNPKLATPLATSQLEIQGSLNLRNAQIQQSAATLSLSQAKLNNTPLPQLTATARFDHDKKATLTLQLSEQEKSVALFKADYQIPTDTYRANLLVDAASPQWINALLSHFHTPLSLSSPLSLVWETAGSSDLHANHTGTLDLPPVALTIGQMPTIQISTTTSYQLPESVTVDHLELQQGDYGALAALHWNGNSISIPHAEITLKSQPIATLDASIPLSQNTLTLQQFFTQNSPWKVHAELQPTPMQQLIEWANLKKHQSLADLDGSASLTLDLSGSPATPEISGSYACDGLRGISHTDRSPLSLTGEFHTAEKILHLSSQLHDTDSLELATFTGTAPFTPHHWAKQDTSISQQLRSAEVDATLKITALPLQRLARLLPQFKKISGTLDANTHITGTLAAPQFSGSATCNIPKLTMANDAIGDLRNIKVLCTAKDENSLTAQGSATLNGSNLTANAKLDLLDIKQPVFDVTVQADHALIYRNDTISLRANAQLQLKGTAKDAQLSGNLDFVESLFYKDIDILPIGLPTDEVSSVELPRFGAENLNFNIPAPFDAWKVNLTANLKDPLLIRGNIARGSVTGSLKATGTLARPALDGTLTLSKVKAQLPFSTLTIPKGYIHFQPATGVNPSLDIQGQSTVGNYDAKIQINGTLNDPKTSFTSYPPLPKNEILTLLATGVTARDLSNNKQAATLRAFQLFLAKLKQESQSSRKTSFLKYLLSAVDGFEFNVNETDRITGRKFSSAKIKLGSRLYLTAQLDDKRNTRGLVVFVLKFR